MITPAILESDFVLGFMTPHQVGAVCGEHCEACPSGPMMLYGPHSEPLPFSPLFIVAEATEEDWKRSVKKRGGNPVHYQQAPHFYFVRTD